MQVVVAWGTWKRSKSFPGIVGIPGQSTGNKAQRALFHCTMDKEGVFEDDPDLCMLKIASELKVEKSHVSSHESFQTQIVRSGGSKPPSRIPMGVTDCIHPQPSCALPLHLISPIPESSGAPLLTLVNGRSSNIIFGQPIQSYIKSIKSYNILANSSKFIQCPTVKSLGANSSTEMSRPPRCRSPQRCFSQTSRPVPAVDVRRHPGHPWCVAGSTLGGSLCCRSSLTRMEVELESLDWFKGKSTGNHGFYHQI